MTPTRFIRAAIFRRATLGLCNPLIAREFISTARYLLMRHGKKTYSTNVSYAAGPRSGIVAALGEGREGSSCRSAGQNNRVVFQHACAGFVLAFDTAAALHQQLGQVVAGLKAQGARNTAVSKTEEIPGTRKY
jgi:hypothetical protein